MSGYRKFTVPADGKLHKGPSGRVIAVDAEKDRVVLTLDDDPKSTKRFFTIRASFEPGPAGGTMLGSSILVPGEALRWWHLFAVTS